MMAFIGRLVRWPNLLIMALTMGLMHYGIFRPLYRSAALTFSGDYHAGFFLLLAIVLTTAAAGYIVNDLHDLDEDRINNKCRGLIGEKLSETLVWKIYGWLNFFSLLLALALSLYIRYIPIFMIVAGVQMLLYIYSRYLKSGILLGNLLVAVMPALMILLLFFTEALFRAGASGWFSFPCETEVKGLAVTVFYAGFAFFTGVIREIIKDIEDVRGDRAVGHKTLVVVYGEQSSRYTASGFLVALLIGLSVYIVWLIHLQVFLVAVYLLVFTFIPLLWLGLRLQKSLRAKEEALLLQQRLRIIMLAGVLSLALYSLSGHIPV